MKKIIITCLIATLLIATFAGCTSNDKPAETTMQTTQTTQTTPPETTTDTTSDESIDSENSNPLTINDEKLKSSYEAVKSAYGEDYIPSMLLEKTMLAEVYGMNMDDVEEIVAEGPMISTHVDTFIGVKAKEGKGEAVEKALNSYREKLVSDSMQYPMNTPKVNASKVVRHEDYVYFVMLGKIYDGDDASSDAATKFSDEQIKLATDAIDKIFA